MRSFDSEADALVVGAGVIGLSVAYELLRRARRVLVLERGRVAGGATAAAAGMLAPVCEGETEPQAMIELGRNSLRRYAEFVAGLERLTGASCGYRTEGTLWVALSADDRAELEHLRATLVHKGLTARELSANEVRSIEPHLSPRLTGGLLAEGDQQVDPRALCRCLEAAVRSMGGEIAAGCDVREIAASEGDGLDVRGRAAAGESFEIRARQVVLAAGAWSGEKLRLPIPDAGVRAIKGQLVRLRGPRLLNHVVRTPRAYLVPRGDGELLVGATMEEMGFDTSATAGAVMDLLRHGWQVLPGLYDLELAEVSVGLRSAVNDHLPVIGPTEIAGLFLAFGHFRNGVLLAPATAHYLAEWMNGGPAPAELFPFRPERLPEHAAAAPGR